VLHAPSYFPCPRRRQPDERSLVTSACAWDDVRPRRQFPSFPSDLSFSALENVRGTPEPSARITTSNRARAAYYDERLLKTTKKDKRRALVRLLLSLGARTLACSTEQTSQPAHGEAALRAARLSPSSLRRESRRQRGLDTARSTARRSPGVLEVGPKSSRLPRTARKCGW